MKVKEAIEKRRSIRKYQKKEVSIVLIKKIVEAARLAPSAYNAQPSKFFIVKGKNLKQRLKENNIFKNNFVYSAPVIIVCCADPEVYPKERFEPIYSNSNEIGGNIGAVRDLSIATQNLVLMATAEGLGTCYIGLLNRDKIKKILNISKYYVVPFAITVGYPAEKPKATSRKKLKEVILKIL